MRPVDPVRLAVSAASAPLPGTDASRLVPSLMRPVANRLLCLAAPRQAELSVLRIGPTSLLFLPGEATSTAEKEFQAVMHGGRTVSLADGYLGYIEAPSLVRANQGESKRQYFEPRLLEILSRAAMKAGDSLDKR